jgi:hypothetical protein
MKNKSNEWIHSKTFNFPLFGCAPDDGVGLSAAIFFVRTLTKKDFHCYPSYICILTRGYHTSRGDPRGRLVCGRPIRNIHATIQDNRVIIRDNRKGLPLHRCRHHRSQM